MPSVKMILLLCLCTILLSYNYCMNVQSTLFCRQAFVFDLVKQLICEADQAAMIIYSQRERSGKAYKGN